MLELCYVWNLPAFNVEFSVCGALLPLLHTRSCRGSWLSGGKSWPAPVYCMGNLENEMLPVNVWMQQSEKPRLSALCFVTDFYASSLCILRISFVLSGVGFRKISWWISVSFGDSPFHKRLSERIGHGYRKAVTL
jgi:hypothetical protein